FADGKVCSDVAFSTFLVEEEHTVPVICLSGDRNDFFDEDRGILSTASIESGSAFPYFQANFWKDWERQVTAEYFVDGERQITFIAGVKVYGQYSRGYDQKSLALHFRNIYGTSSITYPFFEGNDRTSFKGLLLRAGGQDQQYARLRDELAAQVIMGCSDNVLAADCQPVAVYLNGDYRGLYNLREKINEDYLIMYEGMDEGGIDIIKYNTECVAGDIADYNALLSYLDRHGLSNDEYYEYVCTQVDIDSSIDYVIFELFFYNEDERNIRTYRDSANGGKWKWISYDFDMSMRSSSLSVNKDSFNEILRADKIIRNLMANESYKQRFIERYAELLNSAFLPENLIAVMEPMAEELSGEIERNNARWDRAMVNNWKPSLKYWEKQVSALRNVLQNRREVAKKELIRFFAISDERQAELFPNG
ncbi:MAG: CotH kinase family protein, partial [Clostridia bacterium]|nr:CotH kinase family protein [Clostridia bacterium]